MVTAVENTQPVEESPGAYRRLGELCQHDRAKSASTGELCTTARNDSIRLTDNIRGYIATSSGHLSVPQTPTWGGSTESVNNNNSFPCPLTRKINCREPINADGLVEHLGRIHLVTQVHFYDRKATIPIPLPFGADSMYILHHADEIFFFQVIPFLFFFPGMFLKIRFYCVNNFVLSMRMKQRG